MSDQPEILILCGGRGTRLASVVSDVPKSMAPMGGTPFLEILIQQIQKQGFSKFRFLVGYKSEIIIKHFGNGSKWGVHIVYSQEAEPLGTGGCVKKAMAESDAKSFLVFNGDTWFELDLIEFVNKCDGRNGIALRTVADSSRFGQVIIDDENKVVSFVEKGQGAKAGFINAGVYFFNSQAFNYFPPEQSFSIEEKVLPLMSAKDDLRGFPMQGEFIDIGIPTEYARAQTYLVRPKPIALLFKDPAQFFIKLRLKCFEILGRILDRLAQVPKLLFANVVGRTFVYVNQSKIKLFVKENRTRPQLLILRNKNYSGKSGQISTEYFHLDRTLESWGQASFEVLTYDEDFSCSPICDWQLLKHCLRHRPDAVILSSWWPTFSRHPSLETIDILRNEMKIPVIILWWDTCSQAFSTLLQRIQNHFDWHVIIDNPCLHLLSTDQINSKKLISLWPPQDPKLYFSSEGPRPIPVLFLGQASAYRSGRKKVLDYLIDNKVPGQFSAADRNQQVSHEDYAKTIRQAKMVLNFSQSVSSNQLKSRVFEVMLSGALLLESENDQIAKLFTPMKDFVPFTSKEDLLGKINYYLKHEDERAAIAAQGRKTALSLYNSDRFWSQLLKESRLHD